MIWGIAIFSLLRGTPWNGGTFVSILTESPQQEMMNDDAECAYKIQKYKIQNTEIQTAEYRNARARSHHISWWMMMLWVYLPKKLLPHSLCFKCLVGWSLIRLIRFNTRQSRSSHLRIRVILILGSDRHQLKSCVLLKRLNHIENTKTHRYKFQHSVESARVFHLRSKVILILGSDRHQLQSWVCSKRGSMNCKLSHASLYVKEFGETHDPRMSKQARKPRS